MIKEFLSKKAQRIKYPASGILAQTAEARGSEINATIGIGLDDQGVPMHLESIQEYIEGVEPSEIYPYTPPFGNALLREVWLAQIGSKNPDLNDEISLPLVTAGINHAISTAAFLFVDAGDKVLVADKFWGNYKLIFENLCDAQMVTYNTFDGDRLDVASMVTALDSVEDKIIILFNFPNNPTGYTPSEAEMELIASALKIQAEKGKKVIVLIDDAYFGLTYDNEAYHQSFLVKMQGIDENIMVVKLDGASKENFAWGFRIGFITFYHSSQSSQLYDTLIDKAVAYIRANVSSASTLSQTLLLKAMNSANYQSQKAGHFKVLKERFDEVKRILSDQKYSEVFDALPYNSGYFMCIRLKNMDAEKLRQILLEKHSVGVIAIGSDLVRIAYSSVSKQNLQKLFDTIYEICK